MKSSFLDYWQMAKLAFGHALHDIVHLIVPTAGHNLARHDFGDWRVESGAAACAKHTYNVTLGNNSDNHVVQVRHNQRSNAVVR